MEKRCYYEVLECERNISADGLKSSYRKLAMKYHPDRNPGDHTAELKFKEISEAYDCLKDDQKRAAYDRYGHAAFQQGMGGRGGDPFSGFASSFGDVFEDIFGEFMGGGRGRGGAQRRQNRGQDVRYNMEISLEEAFSGKKAEIRVPASVKCETCEGSGAEPGTKPEQCSTCNGVGKIRQQNGFFTIERTCVSCRGTGRVIKKPCKTCHGQGHVQKERTLGVDIPPGVEEGTRIRLSGEGQGGMGGGPNGDLYIFLSVAQHAIFQRDSHDLHCRVPVPFTTAALGGVIEVPTIDGGRSKISIPEGTQGGKQFRLRGKGMPVLRASMKGDLYVEIAVETPVKLSKKQRELLKAFEAEGMTGVSPESEGFFAKVKDFWKGDAN